MMVSAFKKNKSRGNRDWQLERGNCNYSITYSILEILCNKIIFEQRPEGVSYTKI